MFDRLAKEIEELYENAIGANSDEQRLRILGELTRLQCQLTEFVHDKQKALSCAMIILQNRLNRTRKGNNETNSTTEKMGPEKTSFSQKDGAVFRVSTDC